MCPDCLARQRELYGVAPKKPEPKDKIFPSKPWPRRDPKAETTEQSLARCADAMERIADNCTGQYPIDASLYNIAELLLERRNAR